MKQSSFFIKTLKDAPKDEIAVNAILLSRAGYIHKIGAGIYAYLPLALRVMQRIERIVREEITIIGGQELLLPALHPKEYWETTGRWKEFDALYKIIAHEEREYGLGPTHEEIIVPTAKTLIQSYKDLPLYLYQIQTKFRDEARAKSGLLRGREFLMKDLYSFHTDYDDLEGYYERVANAYKRIFERCGLHAIRTKASGGTFSKFSDEYQVPTDSGEDTIYICPQCNLAWNEEIVEHKEKCPQCTHTLSMQKAAEVGNIFKLGNKYSAPFGLVYQDKKGKKQDVIMGCYGIGISRIMGVASEVHHDDKGLIWPEAIAPFDIHLLTFKVADEKLQKEQEALYQQFVNAGIDVLYDNRPSLSDGTKLVEADLIGIPWRIIASQRTLRQGKIEIKERNKQESIIVTPKEFIERFNESNRH